MRVEIKTIDLFGAFKIGAVLSGLLFLVSVVPFTLLQGLVMGTAVIVPGGTASSAQLDSGLMAGLGVAGLCAFVGIGSVVYALLGGVGALVSAFVYNLASGWVGGVEVELERIRK